MQGSFWQQVAYEFRRLTRLALGLVPPKPAAITLKGTEEHRMATVLRHTFSLPPVTAGDTATRRVHYTVNGGSDTHKDVPPADLSFQLDFTADDVVHMTLSDIDKAGNEGAESDPLDFTAKDTFPPGKPGAIGITGVEQVDV